mmetsp:Transcript_8596/g.24581  ORF Transcript_8596/g.24581 Transcript_8596/m.24581 type:complete len:239 (-) Transcript_8596:174-890(-)
MILLRGRSPLLTRITFAVGFSPLSASSTSSATFLLTRSHLLSPITSANSICCIRRGATVRLSSSSAPPLSLKCSARSADVARLVWKAAQSTMVTVVSRRATSFKEFFPPRAFLISSNSQSVGAMGSSSSSSSAPSCSWPPPSSPWLGPTSTAKVSATSCGSLTPVDSTTIASNFFSCARLASSLIRSSRRVQQMHPLCSSTIFASRWRTLVSRTKFASMFTSAMSLTSTATLYSRPFV